MLNDDICISLRSKCCTTIVKTHCHNLAFLFKVIKDPISILKCISSGWLLIWRSWSPDRLLSCSPVWPQFTKIWHFHYNLFNIWMETLCSGRKKTKNPDTSGQQARCSLERPLVWQTGDVPRCGHQGSLLPELLFQHLNLISSFSSSTPPILRGIRTTGLIHTCAAKIVDLLLWGRKPWNKIRK